MVDTILITGMVESATIRKRFRYDKEKEPISVDKVFLSLGIKKEHLYWRKTLGGLPTNIKVDFFDYPGKTLWPKNKESTLTEVLLKTLLRNNNLSYVFLDINEIYNETELAKKILKTETRTISVSTTHVYSTEMLTKILKIIRKFNQSDVILGGRFASDNYLHLKSFFGSYIDYLVREDGEEGYIDLLKCLVKDSGDDKEKEDVPNLVWMTKTDLRENFLKNFDLNKKIFPDWDLANYKSDYIFYEAARGCNFRCRFCTYCLVKNKLILKSAETIFEEWLFYYGRGVRNIKIYDSTFAYPPERLGKLCDLLIDNKIKLKWSCYSRSTDIVSEATAKKMADAGCELVSLGIESGSDYILKNMNKLATAKDHEFALANLKKNGILAQCGFVIGFPGETEKTVAETRDFILKNRIQLANIQPFVIRSTKMLILTPYNMEKFSIRLKPDGHDYYLWSHETMDLETATLITESIKDDLARSEESGVSFRKFLDNGKLGDLNLCFFYEANNLMQKFFLLFSDRQKFNYKTKKLFKKILEGYFYEK